VKSTNSSKKSFIFYTFVAFIVLSVFVFSYAKLGSFTYSEGERTGVIAKFSHKGLILKTYEGELHVGGNISPNWEFSVADPEIVEKIHEAQRSGGRWSLLYRQQLWRQSWKGATTYFIYDVQKVND
jgi:hypothetical protein